MYTSVSRSLQTLGDFGDMDYSSWACANCANVPDPDQQSQCESQCGTAASSSGPTTVVSSLPAGASVSSIPSVLEPSGTSTVTSAINWYRIGLGAILGLAAGAGLYRFAHRRA